MNTRKELLSHCYWKYYFPMTQPPVRPLCWLVVQLVDLCVNISQKGRINFSSPIGAPIGQSLDHKFVLIALKRKWRRGKQYLLCGRNYGGFNPLSLTPFIILNLKLPPPLP